MTKKQINQNDTFNSELLNSIGNDYVFDNSPINRLKNKDINLNKKNENKAYELIELKKKIDSIKDCALKKNSKLIIFGDGNMNSPLMIIGEAPDEKDEISGKTFSGENGTLLKKMLLAINIKKENIYSTYAVNYRPPHNAKPTTDEIKRYSFFLQKHISIINPKLIILMGSTAMQSLTGINKKISLERGVWKDIIIKNISYTTMITFNPSYLLRIPENKKYSWEDLKKIKKKITDLNLIIE
jgi:uracil-DNA glycosylase